MTEQADIRTSVEWHSSWRIEEKVQRTAVQTPNGRQTAFDTPRLLNCRQTKASFT